MTTRATLCYLVRDGKVLLIKKKRGIGQGNWNGPGGRIEDGESVIESAKRELREETGMDAINPLPVGELDFYFGEKEEPDWKVYVLKTGEFEGQERETEEADPVWFRIDEIPYHEMWADDRMWMPLMFQGRKFRGVFHFDDNGEKLLNHKLNEVI
jgi:8-oxo-dGTP diphosphatase